MKNMTLGEAHIIYDKCNGMDCEKCPVYNELIEYCSFEDNTTLTLYDLYKLKYDEGEQK